MKSLAETLVGKIILVLGAIFCMYFLANVHTKLFMELLTPKVTQEDINNGYYIDFIGKSGDDIPKFTGSDLEVGSNNQSDSILGHDYNNNSEDIDAFVVEIKDIIPLDKYRLRNSEWENITKRGYNGRGIAVLEIPLETDKPMFFLNFLYARYYLVELNDGTYILTYMNQNYENSKVSPIAVKELMNKELREELNAFISENKDIDISKVNTDYMLRMQQDESNIVTDWIDLIIRIALTAILGWVLLIIFSKLDKILKFNK